MICDDGIPSKNAIETASGKVLKSLSKYAKVRKNYTTKANVCQRRQNNQSMLKNIQMDAQVCYSMHKGGVKKKHVFLSTFCG